MPGHMIPNRYTYNDIVGVTRGRQLPTVYFSDGAHFTQCHNDPNNIGYHPPCTHLFFGNVQNAVLDAAWQQAAVNLNNTGEDWDLEDRYGEFYALVAAQLNVNLNAVGPVPLIAPQGPQANVKLFEITRQNGQIYYHESGSFIQAVNGIVKRQTLLLELRQKTSNRQLIAGTPNYQFVKQTVPRP